MAKKPNILFALADDASHFGIYGHSFVKTPNIDRVAHEGVMFDNAFTSNPKCAPSRATMLTGRYTWQLEAACNHFAYFPNEYALLPDILDDNGYYTGYTGKGWAPGDYKESGLKRNPAGNAYSDVTLEPPEGSCITSCDYAGNFKRFLSEKPADKPFYFWYGCMEPHRHYSFGEGLRGGKKMSEITEVPPYWPDCDETRIDMLDYAYEIEWFDMHLGRMLKTLEEMGELDNTLVVVTSDNGCPFPRVKGQMYETDFHMPMVAMWKNSNTKPNRRIDDIVNFPDLAPTFLEAAGIEKHPQMWGKSFLDVFKTDRSGTIDETKNVTFFGREKHDLGREGDVGYPVRCIRTHQYLYVYNFKPERWPAGNPETGYTNCDSSPVKRIILEQHDKGDDYYYNMAFAKRPQELMFDIVKDPYCLDDLAVKSEFDDVKKELNKKLFDFLKKSGDPRLDDPDHFDNMPLTSEKDAKYSWKSYMNGTFKKQPF